MIVESFHRPGKELSAQHLIATGILGATGVFDFAECRHGLLFALVPALPSAFVHTCHGARIFVEGHGDT
jgi:hypothetical protein